MTIKQAQQNLSINTGSLLADFSALENITLSRRSLKMEIYLFAGKDDVAGKPDSMLPGPFAKIAREYWDTVIPGPKNLITLWHIMSATISQRCWRKGFASLDTIAFINEAPSCSFNEK